MSGYVRPVSPRAAAELRAVAAALEARTELLVEQHRAQAETSAAYAGVSEEDLQRSGRRNVARVVATLRGDGALPGDVTEDERATGRLRAAQGVPAEDMTALFRAAYGLLRDAFVDACQAGDVSVEALSAGLQELWLSADVTTSALLEGWHSQQLDEVRSSERRRLAFLADLLRGSLPLRAHHGDDGLGHGLQSTGRYWVVRTHAPPKRQAALEHDLFHEGRTDTFAPLLGEIDGELVGVLGRPLGRDALPASAQEGTVVAVDGDLPPAELHTAYAVVGELLAVAIRCGRTGVVDRGSLGLRVAMFDRADVSEALVARYVTPLVPRRAGQDVLRTVHAYLVAGRSVAEAAGTLTVHPNTVRYRLDRYLQATGADLSSTEQLAEAWWALEYAGCGARAPMAAGRYGEDRTW